MKDQSYSGSSSGHSQNASSRKIWLILAMLLAVTGLGLSIYATTHHRTLKAAGVTDAACNINQTVNCDLVASSVYSEIFTIPLGVWGIGYFVALMLLLSTAYLGHKSSKEHLHAYAILVGIGFVASLILGGISFFKIGAVCLVCIAIYCVTALAGVLLVIYRNEIPSQVSAKSVFSGGSTAVIVVAATICAYVLFVPKIVSTTATNEKPIQNVADSKSLTMLPTVADIPISKSPYSGLGEDYRKGNDNAKVVIVEFADFQCPACARVSAILKRLVDEAGDRALVVFKNYPLDSSCNGGIKSKMHEHSCNIAILARCAGQYGKFWEYHDMAFAEQGAMKAGKPEAIAAVVGLTEAQIKTCKESPDLLAKVKDDISTGDRAGVDSTPTIYINGRKYVGERSLEALRTEVDNQFNQ